MANLSFLYKRNIVSDIVQGIIIGGVLALVTVLVVLPIFNATPTNRWITMYGCGESNDNILHKAACAVIFMGPINVPQEAMYWTTKTDGKGQKLSGAHEYLMHFPPGQLPPNNDAFWSLTMGDAKNHFVANPINRYSVSNRSGLIPNSDGSVDIYIQSIKPQGHESNWLPAPSGNFILWLRVYLPGQKILNGQYKIPPVIEVK